MQAGDKKQEWNRPVLTVLVRGTMAESVLGACKGAPGGVPNTQASTCRGLIEGCDGCS